MNNNNQKKIDKTIEDTMDASDPPEFSDPNKRQHGIFGLFEPLEPLRDKKLPASVQEKIDDASAALDSFNRGQMSEEDATAIIRAVRDDPEVTQHLEH